MSIFGLEISPKSNTSNPNLSGTLNKFSLLNVATLLSSVKISVIKSLAALLPISIAANFKITVI